MASRGKYHLLWDGKDEPSKSEAWGVGGGWDKIIPGWKDSTRQDLEVQESQIYDKNQSTMETKWLEMKNHRKNKDRRWDN